MTVVGPELNAAPQMTCGDSPFALLDAVSSSVFAHRGGQILFANTAMERLSGRSRSELAALGYLDLAHEDDQPDWRQFTDACLRNEAGTSSHEFRLLAKDGQVRLVAAKVSLVQVGGQATLIASFADLTERKHRDAGRCSLQRLLRQIVDGSPVPAFVIDADHKLTHWNRACAAITGVPASDMLGTRRQWVPFYPAERPVMADLIVSGAVDDLLEQNYHDKRLKRSSLIESAVEAEDFFPHFGDGGCWLYFTAAPLFDEAGQIAGAIETLQDVTARRKAESDLRTYQAQLETLVEQRSAQLEHASQRLLQSEKLASLGQLAAGVAHEINNPISFVYSNLGSLGAYVADLLAIVEANEAAELSISTPTTTAKTTAPCQKVDIEFLKEDIPTLIHESREGILRVKRIVQNLKEFSHQDSVREWQWADLHKGLDSTINMVNSEVTRTAHIAKEYGTLPEVECLPWELNQVFMNLLINAAHAMGNDYGTITVRTGTCGDEVWVEVADTGSGIPESIRSRIFDPFFTSKPVGKGTGMGLSIAYGIIQAHHGRIELKSEMGQGTTFRVILPIKHSEAADGTEAAVTVDPDGQSGASG
ncbi:PAS domain-containing protein domain S-box [Candidatus Accumulibacter aalborgensis]|uniref:histidine kinase n=1 Tax=Candidatus Accumulibacter aalborgensis TaxID=1860102 RepID=A0A1A8XWJ5_9PROT|nr:ATP-binding protein [Candidatus Accumulibacter aalborgensis]SBT09086.1 PAS domain-containing protein domain S-box [Candidatus Accumulibacter aalborgensis]